MLNICTIICAGEDILCLGFFLEPDVYENLVKHMVNTGALGKSVRVRRAGDRLTLLRTINIQIWTVLVFFFFIHLQYIKVQCHKNC